MPNVRMSAAAAKAKAKAKKGPLTKKYKTKKK